MRYNDLDMKNNRLVNLSEQWSTFRGIDKKVFCKKHKYLVCLTVSKQCINERDKKKMTTK